MERECYSMVYEAYRQVALVCMKALSAETSARERAAASKQLPCPSHPTTVVHTSFSDKSFRHVDINKVLDYMNVMRIFDTGSIIDSAVLHGRYDNDKNMPVADDNERILLWSILDCKGVNHSITLHFVRRDVATWQDLLLEQHENEWTIIVRLLDKSQ